MATKKKRLANSLRENSDAQASWGNKVRAPKVSDKGNAMVEGGRNKAAHAAGQSTVSTRARYVTAVSKNRKNGGQANSGIGAKKYSDYIGSTSKKTGNNPARQYETVGRWDEKNRKINWGLEPKKSDVGRAARNESGYFSKEKLMRSAEKGGVVSTVKKQTARHLSDDPVQRREVAGKARVSSANSAYPSKTGSTAKGYAVREKNRRLKNKMRNK